MAKAQDKLIFYHSPWSRSVAVRWLLEELGVPYEVRLVDVQDPKKVPEEYRAIHPHKKVPAIEHGSLVVTERAAISIYLADTFPEAGLAPALGDRLRAPYLTMLVYCDSVFDPCVNAHYRGLRPAGSDYSFGSYDDLLRNLEGVLTRQEYAAGDRFTAADVQLASSLGFTMHVLQAVPRLPAFMAYLERVSGRPAHARAEQLDAELAKQLAPPQQEPSVVAQDGA